ncbi:hypothetical protein HDU82_001591, partial [Entophlyctis luteolus]
MISIHTFREAYSAQALCPPSTQACTDEIPTIRMTLDGQIVRMRFRNCRMGFLDIRLYGHENGCSCCAKITVVVKADVLPSGTIDSYKKGRLRLGDVIRVGGELGLADTATGWIDNGLLEARLLATAEAIVLSRFSGRGFNPELPVQKHSESLLEHQEPTDNPNTADIHRMCTYWINSNGKCPLALFCKFIHPPIETIPTLRIEWLAIRHSARLEASTADWVDPIPMLLKSPHSMRGKVFAEWILNTFSGSGTLDRIADIAGGAGILAMGLREAGVSGSLTVVDSRPLRIGASLKRWMKRAKKHRVPDASSSGKAQDISTLDSEALARSTLPFSYVQTYFSVNSIPKEVSE